MHIKTIGLVVFLGMFIFGSAYSENPSSGRKGSEQQHNKSAHAEKVADANPRGTEQNPLFVKGIASPESAEEASHRHYEHHEKPLLDQWLTYSTIALAAFTFLLFLYTARLWRTTYQLSVDARDAGKQQAIDMQNSLKIAQESADAARDTVATMRDTAERQLRAYLCVEGFPFFSHLSASSNEVWWSIHPTWRNGGSTPTKYASLNVSCCLRDDPLPEDFDFSDGTVGSPVKIVIGPNSSFATVTISIYGKDLVEVREQRKFFYIWGWAKYKDIFADTPERITKFCHQLAAVTGDPLSPFHAETNIVEATFSVFHKNNCMDDGCA